MKHSNIAIDARNVCKTFTLHLRAGIKLPVIDSASFQVSAGQCAVLDGVSGSCKSSLLKIVYGNYQADSGQVLIQHHGLPVDMLTATPREVMAVRKHTIGYVSQFLRAVPRVSALDIVAEPLMSGVRSSEASELNASRDKAAALLAQLNLPEALWHLPPATFSGGEQQRVNIARGFVRDYPILLLDEPTASLDTRNRDVVTELIAEKKSRGTAILAICHDEPVRLAIADQLIDVSGFASGSATAWRADSAIA